MFFSSIRIYRKAIFVTEKQFSDTEKALGAMTQRFRIGLCDLEYVKYGAYFNLSNNAAT